MNVTSIAAPIDPAISTKVVKSAKTLGSEDFLKLLAVQYKNQDPQKPMDDTAFIAQMAQFSALSQSQTMTTEMVKMGLSQQIATANSFIGKQVIVDDGNGGTATGNVTGVTTDSSGPKIVVGGNSYSISSVLYAEPGTVSTPSTPATTNSGA